MGKEKFISSIGLKSGEKNTSPQKATGNNWKDVDWFLHTWGFLPNDRHEVSKISESGRDYLLLLLLDFAWRAPTEDQGKRVIFMVQGVLNKEGLGSYFENNSKKNN